MDCKRIVEIEYGNPVCLTTGNPCDHLKNGITCPMYEPKETELICPECGSDEIYYARFITPGEKHWYCDDCGYDSNEVKDFEKAK